MRSSQSSFVLSTSLSRSLSARNVYFKMPFDKIPFHFFSAVKLLKPGFSERISQTAAAGTVNTSVPQAGHRS